MLAGAGATPYLFVRSNGVPDANFRAPAERRKANPLNLIRLVPAEGLDAMTSAPQFPFTN
jgi:thiamine transport system substrate-binding protein